MPKSANMKSLFIFLLLNLVCFSFGIKLDTVPILSKATKDCSPPATTVSGSAIPKNDFCPGDLIFEENFNALDLAVWEHENTLAGGGNWEFQWYTNNRSNSYVEDGVLYIRPTLTSDEFGEGFLSSGLVNLQGGTPFDTCTNGAFYGCERQGTPTNLINPIKSARLRTLQSFAFKYGRLEVRAQLPAGDWLWPAIWLMPKRNAYGTWPASGEIDLMESRGNLNLVINGVNIGTEQVGSTLHFGPNPSFNGWPTATYSKNSPAGQGFHQGFHRYQMEWTPQYIKFSIDDVETATIPGNFWNRGGFAQNAPGIENPWRFNSNMAPFDQEFYIIANLAVGGVAYFPDNAQNPGGKPWWNGSPTAPLDFWNGRSNWLPTWRLNENHSKAASLKIDYVRVWAV